MGLTPTQRLAQSLASAQLAGRGAALPSNEIQWCLGTLSGTREECRNHEYRASNGQRSIFKHFQTSSKELLL